MRCRWSFQALVQRFWTEILGWVSFSPLLLSFSEFPTCAVCCFVANLGTRGLFGWCLRDVVVLVCLWRRGWGWPVISGRTWGFWRIPSSSKLLSSSCSCSSSINYFPTPLSHPPQASLLWRLTRQTSVLWSRIETSFYKTWHLQWHEQYYFKTI